MKLWDESDKSDLRPVKGIIVGATFSLIIWGYIIAAVVLS